MIELDEARRRVLAACSPMPPTEVPIVDAVDLVSAESVIAREQVPGFANSAMDGFALPQCRRISVLDPVACRDEPDGGEELLPRSLAVDEAVRNQ